MKNVNNYISHGLGYMSPKEHNHLIEIGAISCDGETDAILSNYPILVIKEKGEEVHVDCGGDLHKTNLEMMVARENQKKCKIEFFPRKYREYIESTRPQKTEKDEMFNYN